MYVYINCTICIQYNKLFNVFSRLYSVTYIWRIMCHKASMTCNAINLQ